MEREFNFVYITTNIVNGKQYIGDHSTDNIDDGYIGSGKYLHRSIKKYSKENFDIEILEYFKTKQEAFDAQEKYIIEFNTLSPNGYNISPKGGYGVPGSFLNEETKQKISKTLKELPQEIKNTRGAARKGKKFSDESIKKIKLAHEGQIPWNVGIPMSEESKQKISTALSKENHPNWNTHLSPETKVKISEANKGKHHHSHSEETKQKISKNNARTNLGKKLSQETCDKMSKARTGVKRGKYKQK